MASSGALPVILGGDHTIAWPDVTGVARHVGWGRVSVIHFDAHADTGDTQFGSLIGHGTPMRRLIESGAARGDRFLQVGLRGYWPEPPTLAWMAEQGMRSFEMTEVVARGLDACLTEAMEIAMDDCDAVFLSVDVDVVDPGAAPGHRARPSRAGSPPASCSTPSAASPWRCPSAGLDVVEVSPPYDHAEVTAYLANRVVLEALSGVAWRRRARALPGPATAAGDSGAPTRPGRCSTRRRRWDRRARAGAIPGVNARTTARDRAVPAIGPRSMAEPAPMRSQPGCRLRGASLSRPVAPRPVDDLVGDVDHRGSARSWPGCGSR